MSNFSQTKNEQTDLLIGALDYAFYLAPGKSVQIPTNYAVQSGPNAGDLAPLPAGLAHVGLLSKSKNPKLSTALDTTPVESYGKQSATRIIRKKRDTTIDVTLQETNIRSLGAYWGQDFTGVVQNSTTGETQLVISESAFNQEYRVVAIAEDGPVGGEIYEVIDCGRAVLDKSGDREMNDDGVFEYPVTFRLLYDAGLKYAVRQTFLGKGWKGSLATKAGFGPAVTGITVTPSTATVSVGGTQQLTTTDSNGQTVVASYASSAPSKASVSSSGLVTGVASGSATVTATFGSFTATSAITVS